MLILTRRVGETLVIGDDVNVTVLGVRGNQVRLVLMPLKKWRFIEKKSTNVFKKKMIRIFRLLTMNSL